MVYCEQKIIKLGDFDMFKWDFSIWAVFHALRFSKKKKAVGVYNPRSHRAGLFELVVRYLYQVMSSCRISRKCFSTRNDLIVGSRLFIKSFIPGSPFSSLPIKVCLEKKHLIYWALHAYNDQTTICLINTLLYLV